MSAGRRSSSLTSPPLRRPWLARPALPLAPGPLDLSALACGTAGRLGAGGMGPGQPRPGPAPQSGQEPAAAPALGPADWACPCSPRWLLRAARLEGRRAWGLCRPGPWSSEGRKTPSRGPGRAAGPGRAPTACLCCQVLCWTCPRASTPPPAAQRRWLLPAGWSSHRARAAQTSRG